MSSVRRDQLVLRRRCSTFVIADKSHFNANKIQLIHGPNSDEPAATNELQQFGKPDKEANISVRFSEEKPDDQQRLEEVEPSGNQAAAKLELLVWQFHSSACQHLCSE
jgi:hypothetical protein